MARSDQIRRSFFVAARSLPAANSSRPPIPTAPATSRCIRTRQPGFIPCQSRLLTPPCCRLGTRPSLDFCCPVPCLRFISTWHDTCVLRTYYILLHRLRDVELSWQAGQMDVEQAPYDQSQSQPNCITNARPFGRLPARPVSFLQSLQTPYHPNHPKPPPPWLTVLYTSSQGTAQVRSTAEEANVEPLPSTTEPASMVPSNHAIYFVPSPTESLDFQGRPVTIPPFQVALVRAVIWHSSAGGRAALMNGRRVLYTAEGPLVNPRKSKRPVVLCPEVKILVNAITKRVTLSPILPGHGNAQMKKSLK